MRENRKSKGKRPMKNTSRQGNISPCRGESAGFFLISSPQANCQLDKRLAVDKIHGSLTSVDVSVPLPRVLRRGDLGEWDKFHSPQEQTLLCNLPCIRYPAGAAPCFQRISPGSRFSLASESWGSLRAGGGVTHRHLPEQSLPRGAALSQCSRLSSHGSSLDGVLGLRGRLACFPPRSLVHQP